jgi:DNA ligase D-like protein (predicted ligase)
LRHRQLPTFIDPMLASAGECFDSDDYLFEIKWDGFRALCYIENGRYRLVGRRKSDFTAQFPELSPLAELPEGTVLDGEIVAMADGKPDFVSLLSRQRNHTARNRRHEVTFIAFDLLYWDFQPVLETGCEQRRQALEQLLSHSPNQRIVLSHSTVGEGKLYFEKIQEMGLEGMVAKKRSAPYEPGKRSGSWIKCKASREILCAIIGYELNEGRLKNLILAAPVEGELRWIGQVGSGITQAMQTKLLDLLSARTCKQPIIPCTIKGKWVVPDLFCNVSFLEWTNTGKLRGPVFESLHGQ